MWFVLAHTLFQPTPELHYGIACTHTEARPVRGNKVNYFAGDGLPTIKEVMGVNRAAEGYL